ncbi:hypothetical protein [Leisingera aquimarina]|uniref:hypothetical protein n=1 Tax=Leisingera aquimarina TaxID=476529 RepID=UPI0004282814|nr:hypothetical protein [Leisingera aquimarina]
MAALSTLRPNPAFRGFTARLKARGKPAKAVITVITVIMHKLIVVMNAKLKDGQASNRYGAAT